MNWLAHALLSEPDPEFRLGNLLADLVRRRDLERASPAFLAGVRRHRAIDAFTDAHPAVHRSKARIRGDYGHANGVLVDVFYDHLLATTWDRWCGVPLDAFTAGLYADLRTLSVELPGEAREAMDRMIDDDRLGSYRRLDGIEEALRRVSMRLQARVGVDMALQRGVEELRAGLDGFAADFGEFFPQLRAHVGA